ncbi:Na,H/K antiporter P-type ATPase, alpha subunit [Dictyocaulus viviparus]|uniref:Na(+)/K(+)-exchanging ATPase n=1 Tax=Dictyocaulus viviparus TaxID=29172 RepID=A0A0D8XSL5_DICVI|nr:Na,H/K antiporter P-type ATPase, alpha subunit [Dictyocaulus viviparus]
MGSLLSYFRKDKFKLEHLKRDIEIDDHAIPLDDLLARLKTDKDTGLSSDEAAARLRLYGRNALTPPYKTPLWLKLFQNLFGGFNMLLWAAAVASLVGYYMELQEYGDDTKADNLYLAITLVTVVTITGVFSFYQEAKSGNIMSSFANMIPTMAHVIRNGNMVDVKVEEVVLGDIVEIVGGDKVPADIRIFQARGLKVDNSSLTGESEPQVRTPEFTHKNPLESKNVAMFSTSVLEGSGRGVVILTADNTVVGRIAALTAQVSSGPSPIAKEIYHFIHIITFVALSVGVTFFVLSIIYGYSLIEALIFFMGIVVANVPEGIVATVTVCLTLTAVKMRRKNCLVKNLEAVETLGSTSTICSDKTGTLTQNRMTVTHLWCDNTITDAEQCLPNGRAPRHVHHHLEGTQKLLMRCAALCSRSKFKAYEKLGGFGERVLGFCDLELDPENFPPDYVFDTENPNFPLTNLRFLGLMSMIDPPRPGVPQAVQLCQSAGIKVVYLRLHPTTAIVIHGEQLKQLSGRTLQEIVSHYQQVVFARTSPTQKLQIVEAYQNTKNVVGVTGDGVNDAPALRKADIGIAMGIAGTDVSKQAADMILLNDNFASIVTGVEEGRLIFDNLKKSIAYTLTSNIPEIAPFMCYVLFGIPIPLSLIAILMIDLGTDLWPAISLAYEVPESDIMERAPRNPDYDKLINIVFLFTNWCYPNVRGICDVFRLILFSYLQIGVIQMYAGFVTYFAIMMGHGWKPYDLMNKRELWDCETLDDLEDSYGQQWVYSFLTMSLQIVIIVVIINLVDAMISVYYGVLMFIYDECRRWYLRKYPTGFIYRETYF